MLRFQVPPWGLFVLLLPLLAPEVAHADRWYEHYARAETALRAEEWTLALEELNQAIGKKSDPEARARTYGMKVTGYFPYFRLGTAYLALGRPDAALQAFETEAGFGAIDQDAAAREEMDRARRRAEEEVARREAAEGEKIREIVAAGSSRARELAEGGRWEEAMAALAPALAVAPDDPALVDLRDRLRGGLAEQQRRAEDERQVASLVARGETALREGRPEEAAGRFAEALSIREDRRAAELLARSREQVRQRTVRADTEAERERRVAEHLAAARNAEDEGEIDGALLALEAALALSPEDERIRSLEQRLIDRRGAQRESEVLARLVAEQLRLGEEVFASDGPAPALAHANRALALAPNDPEALALAGRAYREITAELLGSRPRNLPPALRFFDDRDELDDGRRAESTDREIFTLRGLVVDETPVALAASRDGEPLEVETWSESRGEQSLTHFRLATVLPAGASDVLVRATDEDGAAAESSYLVVYDPPLHRRPLFVPTLVGSLAGGLLLVGVGRRWRRRRLLRRRFNPYVAGAPVLDERRFYGRNRLLDRIVQTIANNSVMLFGERRIGKTSLQHRLKRRLVEIDDPEWQFFPVYIDLQGVAETQFFATLADEVLTELAPHLDFEDERSPLAIEGYGYRELVRDLQRVLKRLAERSRRRVKLVLLIDEVDELNEYDPRNNQRLRSLFMKSFAENLVAVVSGVAIQKNWEREGSPWYNFFEEIEVPPFEDDVARRLVEEPIAGIFALEDGLAGRIVEMCSGKPYLIQKICGRLVSRLHEEGRQTITRADLDAVGRSEELAG